MMEEQGSKRGSRLLIELSVHLFPHVYKPSWVYELTDQVRFLIIKRIPNIAAYQVIFWPKYCSISCLRSDILANFS